MKKYLIGKNIEQEKKSRDSNINLVVIPCIFCTGIILLINSSNISYWFERIINNLGSDRVDARNQNVVEVAGEIEDNSQPNGHCD